MQITDNKAVFIHYTLRNEGGEVLDSSEGRDPLGYLHGAGNIVIGLEEALVEKTAGEKLDVSVPPEKGYGARDDNLIQTVPREAFGGIEQIEPGMQFRADTDQGPHVVTIDAVTEDEVTVDGNHALAGETLVFSVEVVEIRDATEEELEHGHIHGPGGHEH